MSLLLHCLNRSLHRYRVHWLICFIPVLLYVSVNRHNIREMLYHAIHTLVMYCKTVGILYRNLMRREDDFKGVWRADLMFPFLWFMVLKASHYTCRVPLCLYPLSDFVLYFF